MESNHQTDINILNAIQKILADAQGTLEEHQKRINSINYLAERLKTLQEYETKTTPTEE